MGIDQSDATAAHDSPWLTVPQAAARAQCGPRVIYRAISGGKLKASKLTATREYRVHAEWLDAWLASRVVLVNPHAPGKAAAPMRARS